MRYELLKILTVDDNQHMRMLLGEILRAVGVREIFEAADGAAALRLMHGQAVDIVVTDLSMKPMDGIEFMRKLRNDSDSPGQLIPVIMLTGHSTAQWVGEARDAGVNEFITKPVTARSVIDRIWRVVMKPRPFVRSPTYFGPDRRRRVEQRYQGPWRRASDPQQQGLEIELG